MLYHIYLPVLLGAIWLILNLKAKIKHHDFERVFQEVQYFRKFEQLAI